MQDPDMIKMTQRCSIFRGSASSPACLPGSGCLHGPPSQGNDPRAGQAYTEYLIILLFGVFVGLGVITLDETLELNIMDTLYGYIFDYYAGLANFLALPIF